MSKRLPHITKTGAALIVFLFVVMGSWMMGGVSLAHAAVPLQVIDDAGACNLPPGNVSYGNCTTTLNWPHPFPDANYTPVCVGANPSFPSLKLNIVSWSSTGVTVEVSNGTGSGAVSGPSFGGINCIGGYNNIPNGLATITAAPSCLIPNFAYASCSATLNWPQPFADAAYTPVCTGVNPSYPSIKLNLTNWTATGVTVAVSNGAANGAVTGPSYFGGINCIGGYTNKPAGFVAAVSWGSCSIPNFAYASCSTPIGLPQSFPDTQYVPVCSGVGAAFPSIKLSLNGWTTNQITAEVANGAGSGAVAGTGYSGVSCIAYRPTDGSGTSDNVTTPLLTSQLPLTQGFDGQPLNVVMMNSADAVSWPSDLVGAYQGTGPGSTDCSSSDLGYPAPSISNTGATCVSYYQFSSSFIKLANAGGLSISSPSQYTRNNGTVSITADASMVCGKFGCIKGAPFYDPPMINGDVMPGQSASFYLGSLNGAPGTYSESWMLAYDGIAFGTPYNKTIVINSPAVPTVTLNANPTSVTLGGSVNLTWTTTNAVSCTANASPAEGDWSGGEAVNGSASVQPISVGTVTYTLNCVNSSGGGGSGSASVTVAPVPVPPTVSISASPSSAKVGDSITLTWSSTNATTCTASGDWSGSEPTSGTAMMTVSTPGIASYTLTCTGPGGSGNNSASVTVTSPGPTVSISASPLVVTLGNSVNLTWSSTNATVCIAKASPVEADWSGSEPLNGGVSVRPTSAGTVTYTLKCDGPGGTDSATTAPVTVNFAPITVTPVVPGPIPTEPGPVPVGVPVPLSCSGGTGSYTWSSTGPASFTGSGSSTDVSYSSPGIYTVTCTDSNGNSGSVTVTVTGDCTITANPTSLVPPQTSTLTWGCPTVTVGGTPVNVASSCTINGASSISGTSVNTGGSASVSPSSNPATYTLACTAAYGDPSNNAIPPYTATITVGGPGVCETNPNGTGCQ